MYGRQLLNRPHALQLVGSAALIVVASILFLKSQLDISDLSPFHESAQSCTADATPSWTADATPSWTTETVTVISSATPTPSPTGIPEKLWYKLGPHGLSDDSRVWIEGCLMSNPTYRFEFMTDATSNLYVKKYFAHRPDVVETYLKLPIPILKADLLRYLILYMDGGVWSDLDVSCEEIPINEWVPEQYKEHASLVVGLEFDWAWQDDDFLHSQFASWTVMAKPRSPHLLMIVNDILDDIREKTKAHNVTLPNLTLDMVGDVVDITGPKRMTRGIVKSLESMIEDTVDDRYAQNSLFTLHQISMLRLPSMSHDSDSDSDRADSL